MIEKEVTNMVDDKTLVLNKIIADRIMELASENKLNFADICTKGGIAHSTLYAIFGKRKSVPTAQIIIKFARLFNVSTDYLLGLSDVKQKLENVTQNV
jgi:transcriptional regulator with XRE-family HTH domain